VQINDSTFDSRELRNQSNTLPPIYHILIYLLLYNKIMIAEK